MQRTKSGPAAVGATASPEPGRTSENHQTFAYRSANSGNASSVTPGFWRGVRFALAFDLFLLAFVVAAAYLVGYIAVHVPTAVVILGGLVLGGLVVARGATAS